MAPHGLLTPLEAYSAPLLVRGLLLSCQLQAA